MDMPPDTSPATLASPLTPEQLRALLATGQSGLVVFNAPWCLYDAPLLPRLARLQELLGEGLRVGRVDVSQCLELVRALNVRWIPALGHIHRGRLVRRWYGADVDVEQVYASIRKRERS